jgi:hypothetical protein
MTNADPSIAKWAYDFDMDVVYVDREGLLSPSKSLKIFSSIAEALVDPDLSKLAWVWLTADGDVALDEFEHPKDDVVYCIGSDYVGFEGRKANDLPGKHVRLRFDDEWYAVMTTAMLCYDRFLYCLGRRK